MNENLIQVMPLYSQIKEKLLAAISRGEFKAGDQLPSQRELCERYSASHMTVRRAIDDLVASGVISAIPGKGLYVTEPKQDTEASPLISFTEDMARRGMKATNQVLEAEVTAAPTILAKALGVEVGTALVYLRRLRLADGHPMALQTNYLVHACCPGLLEHDLNQNSLFKILKSHYGLQIAAYSATVEAVLASESEAALLGLTPPAALLVTEQISYLENGRAIEFVRSAYRGDRYRMRVR
jgi:GntR family transcriptional regulator